MIPFCLILNPVSGRGAGERALPLVRALMERHGLAHTLLRTEQPWHAAELARQAASEGCSVVVAIGGDGTSNEVINGLMQARGEGGGEPAMGVLCVGRGNDFAVGVGVPKDLKAGVAVLAANHRRRIDIGRVEGGLYPQGRFFGNGVGIGFDAVVGFEALKLKHLTGFPSYVVAALKTLFLYYRAPQVRIQADETDFTLRALMVSIMNGRRMGGGFWMAPEAQHNDGGLDLCIAAEVSRPQILALILRFMRGTQAGHPAIRTTRARHVTVTALEGSLPAHADGETLCTEGRELRLEIVPAALDIVTSSPTGKP